MEETTRRNVVRIGAGAAVGALATGRMLIQSTEPALAASGGLTANDVSVSSTDGTLTTLTVAPDITVEWDGQEDQVAEVQATWKVSTTETSETTVGSTPYTISVEPPTTSGSVNHTFNKINLLSDNDGALSASNFSPSSDGGNKDTVVTLSLNVKLKDADANTLDKATDILGPTDYTVTVTDTTSGSDTSPSVSANGTANTSGSGS